ncbi:MAG: response regulator [Oligoflexia bacterium]
MRRPILVVDDMPAVRSIIRAMLEGFGFARIEEAEDGEQAWTLVRERQVSGDQGSAFSMVLTDWLMPGLEGTDLVREIRSDPATRSLPVLMITSQGLRQQWAEARSAGVTGFVVKPFDEKQLGQELSRIFGR